MASMVVSPEVRYRSSVGQFIAACHAAKVAAVTEVAARGADMAQDWAPYESGELEGGIRPVVAGDVGYVISVAPHTLPIERGASAHPIGAPGQVLANPEKGFGPVTGPVMHPGNAAQPFLRPAFAWMKANIVRICARHYP